MSEIDASTGAPDVGTALLDPFQTGLNYTNAGANVAGSALTPSPYRDLGASYIMGGAGPSAPEQSAYNLLNGGVPNVSYSTVDPTRVGATSVSAPGVGVDTNTQQMMLAMKEAGLFTDGALGDSPAIHQAMKAWEDLVRPTVLAGEAITGTLGGGATSEALGHSKTEALTPLLQKEMDIRAGLIPQLGQLGLGASGQELDASKATADLGLRAAMANQDTGLRAGMANQATDLTAAQANQQAGLTAGQANQNSAMRRGEAMGALGGQQAGRQLQGGALLSDIGSKDTQTALQVADSLMRAGGQTGALGAGQEQVYMDIFRQALQASGMPREQAAQQAQVEYQDFLRLMGLAQQMYLGPTGNYVAGALTPGSTTDTTSSGGGLFGS